MAVKKKLYSFRLSPADIPNWKAQARAEGRTLTNWIWYHITEYMKNPVKTDK